MDQSIKLLQHQYLLYSYLVSHMCTNQHYSRAVLLGPKLREREGGRVKRVYRTETDTLHGQRT